MSEGNLVLQDGNGHPVNVRVQILPDGVTLQPQSTPADPSGTPFSATNPLPVSDVALAAAPGAGPEVRSRTIEDLLVAILIEQRLQTVLLAEAFSLSLDVAALREDLARAT